MDDILARAACDSRITPVIEDIAKAIENENRDCVVSQAHIGGCRSSCSRSPENVGRRIADASRDVGNKRRSS